MTGGLTPFGWFDDDAQTTPVHDPGFDVSCPVCGVPLNTEPRTTISLMPADGKRSLFFRAHKRCWDAADESKRQRIESAIIDPEVAKVT